jgi:hypothetical protein
LQTGCHQGAERLLNDHKTSSRNVTKITGSVCTSNTVDRSAEGPSPGRANLIGLVNRDRLQPEGGSDGNEVDLRQALGLGELRRADAMPRPGITDLGSALTGLWSHRLPAQLCLGPPGASGIGGWPGSCQLVWGVSLVTDIRPGCWRD